MPRLVMKFGGTSVATVERIRNVARHVAREVEAGYDVAGGVSALGRQKKEIRGRGKGRGGSDTSAVALAAGIGAERCDIYTDVDGVYTSDPRIVSKARRLDKVSYEEMLEMASLGAKVLQVRSVELAMMHR